MRGIEKRVKKAIEERTGYNVTVQDIVKTNVNLTGFVIDTGRDIRPVVYMEDLMDMYVCGKSFDEIIDDVVEQIKEDVPPNPLEGATSDMLNIRVINRESNEEFLKDKPNIKFADLAAVFEVVKEGYHAVLTHDVAKQLGYDSAEDLMRDALKNASPILCDINGFYDGVFGNLLEEPNDDDGFMYILSNKDGLFGAAMICSEDIRQRVAMVIGSGYYVLPSSVHELIVVPKHTSISVDELKETVIEANETIVSDSDILSNSVYFVDEKGNLEVIG